MIKNIYRIRCQMSRALLGELWTLRMCYVINIPHIHEFRHECYDSSWYEPQILCQKIYFQLGFWLFSWHYVSFGVIETQI